MFRRSVWSSLLHFSSFHFDLFHNSSLESKNVINGPTSWNKRQCLYISNPKTNSFLHFLRMHARVFLPFFIWAHPTFPALRSFSRWWNSSQVMEIWRGACGMRLSEIPTLSLDIKYNPETCRSPPHKSNAFDVNSVSGFPCFGCKSICFFGWSLI